MTLRQVQMAVNDCDQRVRAGKVDVGVRDA